jgi:hypothetical protein
VLANRRERFAFEWETIEAPMSTTTFQEGNPTLTIDGHPASKCPDELMKRYQSVLDGQRMSWT